MKYLTSLVLLTVLAITFFTQPVWAADDPCQNRTYQSNPGSQATSQNPLGVIERPCWLISIAPGVSGINYVINIFVKAIYSLAGIAVLIMIVWGAISWIVSGGNKESLQAAQKRIVSAIVGAIILAIAAPLTNMIMNILGLGNLFS